MRNKKLFGLFNIFDFLIILVFIAVAAGIASRLNLTDKISVSASDTPMTFTVVEKKLRDVSAESIAVGQSIFDSETGMKLGTITDVRVLPAYDNVKLSNGQIVRTAIPERYDVYITAEGVGKVTSEGNLINGSRHLAPGGKLIVATDKFTGEGIVTACRVLE